MEDIFLRTCREICHDNNYIIITDDNFLKGLNKDVVRILNRLIKECRCRILIITTDEQRYKEAIKQFKGILNFMDGKDTTPLVFISHHWDPENDKYTKQILEALTKANIKYGIDKDDAKYRMKLTDMEEKIGDGFIVIAIINEEYLKSIECMYELALVCKNGHIKDRLFPVTFFKIDSSGDGLICQLIYWNKKLADYQNTARKLGPGNANIENNDIIRINDIINQLPNIWIYLKEYLTSTQTQLSANNYKLLIDSIKKRLTSL